MAIAGRQPSNQIEHEHSRKAIVVSEDNENSSMSSSGNETISGQMAGSSLILNKADGQQVVIVDVDSEGAFDHFIANSTTTPVTDTEAQLDWSNV